MSYDIYLEIDTGSDCLTTVVEVGNYTSNVSPMWTRALGEPLRELDGQNAGHAVALLDTAISAMQAAPAEYREMNPANGWGRYEGALDYLKRLRAACAEHPKTTIRVSS
ncbi:hypothetical protein [Kitasatospora sp. NPDC056531]|uniref:hypothetical protein n=1 Tax=Kitasatospora sp. NPDC056531 TaxID=3345856 RepID=UPI003682EF25